MTEEKAVKVISAGTLKLAVWHTSTVDSKMRYLDKEESAISIHLQTGAITKETAAQKQNALTFLRKLLREEEK